MDGNLEYFQVVHNRIGNVRFGSTADVFAHSTGRSAAGGIAAMISARNPDSDGPESAKSSLSAHHQISPSEEQYNCRDSACVNGANRYAECPEMINDQSGDQLTNN